MTVTPDALLAQIRYGAVVETAAPFPAAALDGVEPLWLVFGLCAQAAILVCFGIHLVASWKRQKLIIPPSIGYVGLVATLMLMIYASLRHDAVFLLGQFLNTLICVRLLMLIRRAQEKMRQQRQTLQDEPSGFPIVSPDSVNRRLPKKEP